MRRLRTLAAGVIAMVVACGALAQHMYRWVDENGRTHVTDTPPPPSAKNVQKKALVSNTSSKNASPAPELEAAVKDAPVVFYSAPACPEACASARDLLNKRGVPFQEVYVWEQQGALELKRLTGGVVIPSLLVGTHIEQGFDPGALNAALDAAHYPKQGVLPARTQAAPPVPREYLDWQADKAAERNQRASGAR